jgi:hypothetical protein
MAPLRIAPSRRVKDGICPATGGRIFDFSFNGVSSHSLPHSGA